MRPRKRILLAGDDADDIGVMAFVLECHQYRVDRWLPRQATPTGKRDGAILICSGDQKLDEKRASVARSLCPGRVLALTPDVQTTSMHTDVVLSRSIAMGQLLPRLHVLTTRKRGPKKEYKTTISTLSTGFIHRPEKTVEKGA